MKVLFIGDIMGEPGRRAIARTLHKVVAQHAVDLVIGNGENVAGGFGITPELAHELYEMGLAVITTGNHAWDKKEILDFFPQEPRLLRPANYPDGVPGRGSSRPGTHRDSARICRSRAAHMLPFVPESTRGSCPRTWDGRRLCRRGPC